MDGYQLFLFVFLTGATVTGLSSAIIEMALKCRLSFSDPLFAVSRPFRSIAASMVAGPAMLFNDAIEARAERRIGLAMMLSCFVTCAFWIMAIGVISLEIFWQMAQL